MKSLFIIVILTGCSIAVLSQNFTQDFTRINKAYFLLNKKITMTSNVKTAQSNETFGAEIYLKDIQNFYIKTPDSEILVRNGVKTSVNHSFKVIMLDSNYNSVDFIIPTDLLDTIQKFYKAVSFTKINNSTGRYTLIPSAGKTKKIVLDFDLKSFEMVKVEMTLNDPHSQKDIVMVNKYVYSTLNINQIPLTSSFYTEPEPSLYKPSTKYLHYQLINHL